MRGRYPSGPEYVEHLQGSPQAKARAKVVLEVTGGRARVLEACAQLGISEQRFYQLREGGFQALVDFMESRPAGRPPQPTSAADQRVRQLEAQVAALELELRAARAQVEIATVLPRLVHEVEPEKKTSPPATRRRRRRRRSRTPP